MKMNAKQKLNDLIAEYCLLKTEEERTAFDNKMKQMLAEMDPEERKSFRMAFLESAKIALSDARAIKEDVDFRLQLNGIEEYLSLSKIAEDYFGKSRSWLYQRINGLNVNGKPAQFTEEEKKRFGEALQDISRRIKDTAVRFN
ncbi:DUF5053 domain-containing protein [Parabacteroides sp. AF48-14]|uniref:DUF5053 domain-containing protein n=1 Tax=Parabacteroides sp. AF48-14 TaxID=2292052 RepID=UPI000F000BEA|nr:DUF5053 domain-containing protein [Parabacteroides sp. AF48-14]RHO73467.1 DUF5053 domain-containing protein [Parabacteroides sp. AF48-14]